MDAHRLIVIGGGVAGVTVVEETLELMARSKKRSVPCCIRSIVLISASPTLKGIENITSITESLETFDVVERLDSFEEAYGDVVGSTGICVPY